LAQQVAVDQAHRLRIRLARSFRRAAAAELF